MGKYLFQVSYTAQGAKGLLEGGGGDADSDNHGAPSDGDGCL